MRKIISISVLLVLSFQIGYTQKFVSTSPQNKTVVLEEFTGIRCSYCPDGHRRANDLVVANPGRVILVNIHAGGFASPQTGQPDFRTDEGSAINTAAGVTGYPSGSVNRSTTPWGKSRSEWESLANGILSQSSPVNVAVQASIDHITRELTVEVEAYYTASSPQSKNYLSVMLLQDNVLGPQADGNNYYPANWVNGQYIHSHILRKMLTATMGDEIDTTTSGHYFIKKYVTTLPEKIKNVDLLFYNLRVVAFVSETSANIYSGDETLVEFDETIKTDLGIRDLTEKPAGYCFTTINPRIEVTNHLDNEITDFEVSAIIDGVTYKKTYSGSLSKNDTAIIDWGTINFTPSGSYMVEFIGFNNINGGGIYDVNLINDFITFSGIGFKRNAFSQMNASFENSIPQNVAFDLSDNSKFSLVYSTSTSYGAKSTRGAVRFPLHTSWDVAGKPGRIIFGEADLSKLTNPYVSYYYAYSDDAYGGTKPTIKLEVSEDCGSTWKEVRTITCNETGAPTTHGNWYVPKSTEYVWTGIPLTDYKDKSVLLRLVATPGTHGNALYVDEIRLAETTGIVEDNNDISFTLYPNPASDFVYIDFRMLERDNVQLNVYNALGQLAVSENMSMQGGNHTFKLNTNHLDEGIYILHLTIGDQVFSRKFIVQ